MANVLDRNTRAATATRLLRAAQKGYDASVTSPAITVTDGTADTSTLNGVQYNSSLLLKTAANAYPVGGGFKTAADVGTNWSNGGGAFITDAPVFEFWMQPGKWEIYIDGKPAPGNPYTAAAGGFKRVDFGSAAQRHVELRFAKAVGNIKGVAVRKPWTIWAAAPLPSVKVAVIGDSYTEAEGYGGLTAPGDGWAQKLGRWCNLDTIAMGLGGTGYTVAAIFYDRLSSIPADTDLIIFAGGINDYLANTGVLTTAVQTCLAQARLLFPSALIMVLGPWRAPGKNPSQAISDAIKAGYTAVADNRMTFVDTYAENWQNGSDFLPTISSGALTFTAPIAAATSATLTAGWGGSAGSYTIVFDTGTTKTATLTNGSTAVSWTGAITAGVNAYGSTAASGNSGIYISTDGVHPVAAGHSYLANRVKTALTAWLRTLV